MTASSINSKVWLVIKGTTAPPEIPGNQETRVPQAYLVHVACLEKEEFQGCQEYKEQLWVFNKTSRTISITAFPTYINQKTILFTREQHFMPQNYSIALARQVTVETLAENNENSSYVRFLD